MTHLLSETARAKHFRISSVWPWPRWRPVFFGIRETVHSTDASADVKSMNPKHSVKESGSVKTRKLLWSKYWKTAWCQTLPLKFRGSRLVILNQSPLTPIFLTLKRLWIRYTVKSWLCRHFQACSAPMMWCTLRKSSYLNTLSTWHSRLNQYFQHQGLIRNRFGWCKTVGGGLSQLEPLKP